VNPIDSNPTRKKRARVERTLIRADAFTAWKIRKRQHAIRILDIVRLAIDNFDEKSSSRGVREENFRDFFTEEIRPGSAREASSTRLFCVLIAIRQFKISKSLATIN
jgi:hypothetical protein